MNILEIELEDDAGQPFCPYTLAAENLGKATPQIPQHAAAAAVCLEILAREIRQRFGLPNDRLFSGWRAGAGRNFART